MLEKGEKMFSNGLYVGDMGTRRRFSFEHQRMVVETITDVYKNSANKDSFNGVWTGTSNVWFAKEFDINCLGTMSHQIISFEENVSGVFEANHAVMQKWVDVYDGDAAIYLYDCFGDSVFFSNLSKKLAMLYKGLRVDSGNDIFKSLFIVCLKHGDLVRPLARKTDKNDATLKIRLRQREI